MSESSYTKLEHFGWGLKVLKKVLWIWSVGVVDISVFSKQTGGTPQVFCSNSSFQHRKLCETMYNGGYTAEVTSLSPKATENDVYDFFSHCGTVEHVEILRWIKHKSLGLMVYYNL